MRIAKDKYVEENEYKRKWVKSKLSMKVRTHIHIVDCLSMNPMKYEQQMLEGGMLTPVGQYAHICTLPQGSHLILNIVLRELHSGHRISLRRFIETVFWRFLKTEIAKGMETIN